MPSASLSPHGLVVRRYDRERFVAALFAAPPQREALFTLYAFNLEIARIRETVRETLLGEIRLQWWRDSLERLWQGAPIGHPVADDLAVLVRRLDLPRLLFDRLLEARSLDMAPPPATVDQLQRYVDDSAGGLAVLAAAVLGCCDPVSQDAARRVGQAWGLIGLLRAHAYHIKMRRLYLPADLLLERQLDAEALLAGESPPGLARLAEQLADLAAENLRQARALRPALSRAVLPALLPARLADGYLRRLKRVGFNLLDRGWSEVDSRPLVLLLANAVGRF